jgi:arsenate reductase
MAQGFTIQEIDALKEKLTGTQIVELTHCLDLEVAYIVNLEHPDYTSNFKHQNFSTNDWIKMMQNHPEIMKQPIAL